MLSTLLALLFTVEAAHKGGKQQLLSRITKYELLYLNQHTSNPDIKAIELDIYNQHYSVQSQRNDDMMPSNAKHYNIDLTTHKHKYFSSLTESVLNTNDKSLVAISLCPNLGIRGTMESFNKTLIIQPSAYYLELQKDKNDFYKLTDFNTSDVFAINDHTIHKHNRQKKTSTYSFKSCETDWYVYCKHYIYTCFANLKYVFSLKLKHTIWNRFYLEQILF